jgi:hypothetical protein
MATATPSPTATPTPLPSAPRPDVGITAVPNGDGRLRVTTAAQTNANTPTNTLGGLAFPEGANAGLDVGLDLAKAPPYSVALPPGTQQTTVFVRRVVPGQASTLQLVVTDRCGAWPTMVGGGAAAF